MVLFPTNIKIRNCPITIVDKITIKNETLVTEPDSLVISTEVLISEVSATNAITRTSTATKITLLLWVIADKNPKELNRIIFAALLPFIAFHYYCY
jgi:hypothetical protein